MPIGITLGKVSILRGEKARVRLPIASYYGQSRVTMPLQVVCGKLDGPILFVNACIHGDEVNGIEILRRIHQDPVLDDLRGTLIVIPVVNVYGFFNRSRYLPDRRDLNRCFPGSRKGSLAGRIAEMFITEVASKATHGIDLHTGSMHRSNLPQVRAEIDRPEVKELARAFGAPVILDTTLRDGSLREAVADLNIPVLVYEGGEALRFDEIAIRAGVAGVFSVMRKLEMLPPDRVDEIEVQPFIARSSRWVRAPESGVFRTYVPLGARVKKEEVLGHIGNPFGELEVPVIAPFAGIVIGRSMLPPTHEGEALFHIASFQKLDSVEASLEQFQSEHSPDTDEPGDYDIPPIF